MYVCMFKCGSQCIPRCIFMSGGLLFILGWHQGMKVDWLLLLLLLSLRFCNSRIVVFANNLLLQVVSCCYCLFLMVADFTPSAIPTSCPFHTRFTIFFVCFSYYNYCLFVDFDWVQSVEWRVPVGYCLDWKASASSISIQRLFGIDFYLLSFDFYWSNSLY